MNKYLKKIIILFGLIGLFNFWSCSSSSDTASNMTAKASVATSEAKDNLAVPENGFGNTIPITVNSGTNGIPVLAVSTKVSSPGRVTF